jgi:hypothetical protein
VVAVEAVIVTGTDVVVVFVVVIVLFAVVVVDDAVVLQEASTIDTRMRPVSMIHVVFLFK